MCKLNAAICPLNSCACARRDIEKVLGPLQWVAVVPAGVLCEVQVQEEPRTRGGKRCWLQMGRLNERGGRANVNK